MSPVFIYNQISGELVLQAERKVQPSTHIPDLDNANVGTFVSVTGNFQIRGFPYFYFRRCDRGKSKRNRAEYCGKDGI